MPVLKRLQKKDLKKASRIQMEEIVLYLKVYFHQGMWVGLSNRYIKNCIDKIKSDCRPGHTYNQRHLKDYIAASAFLHNTDGWSFLGKALHSHTKGDPDMARHSGYYAELRAAIAILACEGIGVFERNHFVININGDISRVNKKIGTHVFVWEALEHWAGLRKSADLIGLIITPNNVPLKEWIDSFTLGSSAIMPIASNWLKNWGLDLKKVSEDQELRNESSYRPNRLSSTKAIMPADEAVEFIKNFWSLCEPSGDSRFQKLDKYLLRISLEMAFYSEEGKKPLGSQGKRKYMSRINKMLIKIVPDTRTHDNWKSFFLREIDPLDPEIFIKASKNSEINDAVQHTEIISRSMLLLRISSGCSQRLLREASVTKLDLKFWWEKFLKDRGILENVDPNDDLTDLWADIEMAIDDLEQSGRMPNYYEIHSGQSRAISVLTECERASVWGIGL